MKHGEGAEDESPDEPWNATYRETDDCVPDDGDPVVAVDPAELREARQIGHVRIVARSRHRRVEDPADMRIPEAAVHRRMRVAWAIGELVVTSVNARPPNGSVLHARRAQYGEDELECATRLVC